MSNLTYQELIASLPAMPSRDWDATVRRAVAANTDAVIVLDDDPTGTQTVYDIPVLTTWTAGAIREELERGTSLFYILTNSRSLPSDQAEALAREIGQNIRAASRALAKECLVISRSDSTLRGHYPIEVKALEKGLGIEESVHFIIPAFFEGGRYTIGDVHYVKDGERMIPAAQTPFAEDKVFGFHASDLKEWVYEKTAGAIPSEKVKSIGLKTLREDSLDELQARIGGFRPGEVCIVNAADYADLKKVAVAILQSGIHPVFRTAASFVAALAAQPAKSLLTADDLNIGAGNGGLIAVGSYVPKSTRQLEHLLQHANVQSIEVDVEQLLAGKAVAPDVVAGKIDKQLQQGKDVVLYTSRKLISGGSPKENLEIGRRISSYLTSIVAALSVKPGYLLTKGGITSSDIATESLRARRAMVRGQVLPGVPVWTLGEESVFPGLPLIVFPGNVGEEDSLTGVVGAFQG